LFGLSVCLSLGVTADLEGRCIILVKRGTTEEGDDLSPFDVPFFEILDLFSRKGEKLSHASSLLSHADLIFMIGNVSLM